MSRLTRILLPLFIVLSITFPLFAQDVTIEPTSEFITVVPSEVPTLEPTVTPEPTVAPTPEPTPTPDPTPTPEDNNVPEWVFVMLVVLATGLVTLGIVAIIQSARQWPAAARELLLSLVGTGVDELGKVAGGTETKIDDMAVEELRKLVERLRAELRETQQQVAQNAAAIQTVQRS